MHRSVRISSGITVGSQSDARMCQNVYQVHPSAVEGLSSQHSVRYPTNSLGVLLNAEPLLMQAGQCEPLVHASPLISRHTGATTHATSCRVQQGTNLGTSCQVAITSPHHALGGSQIAPVISHLDAGMYVASLPPETGSGNISYQEIVLPGNPQSSVRNDARGAGNPTDKGWIVGGNESRNAEQGAKRSANPRHPDQFTTGCMMRPSVDIRSRERRGESVRGAENPLRTQ